MKAILSLAGVAGILLGLLFAGQGLGYIPWPHSSFMVGQIVWAWYGLGITATGILLIAFTHRSRGG
jgi:hypothetical protein